MSALPVAGDLFLDEMDHYHDIRDLPGIQEKVAEKIRDAFHVKIPAIAVFICKENQYTTGQRSDRCFRFRYGGLIHDKNLLKRFFPFIRQDLLVMIGNWLLIYTKMYYFIHQSITMSHSQSGSDDCYERDIPAYLSVGSLGVIICQPTFESCPCVTGLT